MPATTPARARSYSRMKRYIGGVCDLHTNTLGWAMSQDLNSGNELAVLITLAAYADEDGRGAAPTVKELARRCFIGERTVHKHLHRLEKRGLITEASEPVLVGSRWHQPRVWDLNLDVHTAGAEEAR